MKFSTVFCLLILVLLGIIIVISLSYPYDAKLFPLALAFPTTALTAIQIVKEIRTEKHTAIKNKGSVDKKISGFPLSALAWIVLLLLLVYSIGLLAGLSFFTFLYLKFHRQTWLLSSVIPIVMIALVYGAFVVGLKLQLYKGFLFE